MLRRLMIFVAVLLIGFAIGSSFDLWVGGNLLEPGWMPLTLPIP